jgi:hypothetical protein
MHDNYAFPCIRKEKNSRKNEFSFGCGHDSVYFLCMNPSKEQVKRWLSEHKDRDRDWLAAKCGVTKRTVDNWLSSGIPIPTKAQHLLAALMREDVQPPVKSEPETHLSLQIKMPEFHAWSAIALENGQTLIDWIISSIRDAYERDQRLKKPTLMVAEDPAPYGAKTTQK